MSKLEEFINTLGAEDLLTITQRINELIEQHEQAKGQAWRIRTPNTEYKQGDKVIAQGVSNFDKVLKCEQTGTTGEGEFPADYNTLNIGDVVNDGSVAWGVVSLASIPDLPDSPVTSVNGKTGDVNLTNQNVGAEPLGKVKEHNEDSLAHEELFKAQADLLDEHATLKADTETLGHVQIDGKTIVWDNENNVIKAIGGRAIGEIFAYPATVPPAGAYILNGQTIENCANAYPQFWEWLNTASIRKVDNTTYENELATTGVCDGFVVDVENQSVRLPKWYYQSPLTDVLGVRGNGLALGFTGDFSITDSGYALWCNSNGTWFSKNGFGKEIGTKGGASFPANQHYGITGNTDYSGLVAEVSSASNNFVLCIQVYNTATDLSTQESANLASLMQAKAQVDLANVISSIDFVIESWSDDNGNWYRKYRSGWIEQGGNTLSNVGSGTVTLLIEMTNNKYGVNISYNDEYTSTDTGGADNCPSCSKKTINSFRYSQYKATGVFSYWEVKGYAK